MINRKNIRSFLFCPSNQKEKFSKALKSNADIVIFDLEDAVSEKYKSSARVVLSNWLKQQNKKTFQRIAIRINPVGSKEFELDLKFLFKLNTPPEYIVLPKIESEKQLLKIEKLTSGLDTKIIPIIESSKGVIGIEKILDHKEKFAFLMIGNADLSADIGCNNTRTNMQYSNSKVLLHAAAHSIQVIDSPYFLLNNIPKFEKDTLYGKSMGFSSRAAIHPQQIEIINKVYTYSEKQINEAKRILQLAEKGVVKIDNKMIDEAMLRKAKIIIKGN